MTQLVRYKSGKTLFEVATKSESVRKYRTGKLGWNNVLVADEVFVNFKKGNVAKGSDLEKVFGKISKEEILKKIVEEGDLQVSANERKEDIANHRQRILGYLHKTYVDANGLPHPMIRLESVLEESKVRLDQDASIQSQVDDIIKKMLGKLVFRKNSVDHCIFITHDYAKKCQPIIQKLCIVERESWDHQGCKWIVGIAPGDIDTMIHGLNNLTGGDFMFNIGRNDPRKNETEDRKENTKRNKKNKRT